MVDICQGHCERFSIAGVTEVNIGSVEQRADVVRWFRAREHAWPMTGLGERLNQMGADETCSARDQRSNQGNLRDKDWRNYGPTSDNQTLY